MVGLASNGKRYCEIHFENGPLNENVRRQKCTLALKKQSLKETKKLSKYFFVVCNALGKEEIKLKRKTKKMEDKQKRYNEKIEKSRTLKNSQSLGKYLIKRIEA